MKSSRVPFDEVLECAILAHGMVSTKYIAKRLHLSAGQVSYRLRISELKLKRLRDGEDPNTEFVIKEIHHAVQRKIEGKIKVRFNRSRMKKPSNVVVRT